MSFSFNGKNIVICGCTSGIGLSTTLSLSEQGAKLFLIGRNEDKLKTLAHQLNAHYYALDLSKAKDSDYEQLAFECQKFISKIDGIVYTAGVAAIMPIRNITRDCIKHTFKVNLYGFISIIKALVANFECYEASIVGISSGAALNPAKGQIMYAASKAAMNVATQSLACELLDKKIRINTILPWIVDTKMIQEAKENGTMSIERLEKFGGGGYSNPR